MKERQVALPLPWKRWSPPALEDVPGKFYKLEVPRDGNCMFSCFAVALNLRRGVHFCDPWLVRSLAVCSLLKNDLAYLKEILGGDEDEEEKVRCAIKSCLTHAELRDLVSRDALVWGNHCLLLSLLNGIRDVYALDLSVTMLKPNGDILQGCVALQGREGLSPDECVLLCYDGTHYNLVGYEPPFGRVEGTVRRSPSGTDDL